MPDEHYTPLREYVDMRFSSRRETIDAQFKAVNDRLTETEKRFNDRLAERDGARIKAAEVMDERLEQMNRFRDQINSERASYVTLDRLELNLKGLHDQMAIITKTITLTSGQREGVSNFGSVILSVLVGLSALMSGISAFLIIASKIQVQ